ncbi:MAG: asnB [Burkholderiales bacterium]|nr:asnB [Burkholderiales bacterium]
MGAIAGWIAPGRSAPDDGAVAFALEALAHRGAHLGGHFAYPTENGYRVVLGEAWCDPDSQLAVVLDGTIANEAELRARRAVRGYRFANESPAETLLHAYEHWDKDVVHHLNGAFAFALWDAGKERLMLARDRLGEKPLYVAESAGRLYFASQQRAMVRMPGLSAEPDPAAVREYLAYRYVPGPRTLLRGIRKLVPGTCTLWQFGRTREIRYWAPPDRTTPAGQPTREPVGQFTEKLEDAVKARLPAGVLLSGGLDSAVLVALAAKHGGGVRTYSGGFEGDRYSELARAAQVAKHFGTEHHEIVLSPRDLVDRLPHAVAHRDAPVSRPSDVALHCIAREASRTSRAVLTGDGTDEVLGGYRRHVAERYGWLFRSVPTLLILAAPLAHRRPKLQNALASLRTPDWRQRLVRWIGVHNEKIQLNGKAVPPFDGDPRASSLRRALYFDQASWLPDHVLERSDRMTMAASLESRAPYLDHRLVELVSALPDEWRVRGLSTKRILRAAAQPLLGGLRPRKAGFRIPAGDWLRGEMRELLLDHLRGQSSLTRVYYEPRVLDRVLDEHLAGKRDHETLLWTLLNLEIWHRTALRA